MPSEGTKGVTRRGQGEGNFPSSRSLAKTKRRFVPVPTDENLHRDFGSKKPDIISRRRDVALLWRGGASSREITRMLNDHADKENARLEAKGFEPTFRHVSLVQVQRDLREVKKWIRAEFAHAIHNGHEEIIVAIMENVWDAIRLKSEAVDFREKAIAIQTFDNVARSFLKIIGVGSDITVDVRKTDIKAALTISGAPPEVRMAHQEALDAEYSEVPPS